MRRLPTPEPGPQAAEAFVGEHLHGLFSGPVASSPRFRGGQRTADEALAAFDVSGYADARNEVNPPGRRGASALSPWIRHGLLSLPTVWERVEGGPGIDVRKFRDELLWQEYTRHCYARLGRRMAVGLRREPGPTVGAEGWDVGEMACLRLVADELEGDGWLPNQARMWFASHWSVRRRLRWQDGEDHFFRHLLDGSRAANRFGWQWTLGLASTRSYGFSRLQVERRAPGLCATCPLCRSCPIEGWPGPMEAPDVDDANPLVASDPDPRRTTGPLRPVRRGDPGVVWLTAESLGSADRALAANPGLPAVFVFDEALLCRLGLTAKRLVFLTECLAELAAERVVELWRGDPAAVMAGRAVAATFAPVPGFRRLSAAIDPVEVHPWRWLRVPNGRTVASFSAWLRSMRL